MALSFLFTIQPVVSHLNPMVPLARRLVANGHDVVFATARDFLPAIRAKGFERIDAGLNWTVETQDEIFPERAHLPVAERSRFDIGVTFAERAPPVVVTDLSRQFGTEKPDLIIRDDLEFGGYLTAEKWNIPHATINIAAAWQAAGALLVDRIRKPLTQHRDRYGLSPDHNLDSLFRYLRLDTAPPSLLPQDYARTPTTHTYNSIQSVGTPPVWIDSLPYSRTVLVTLGTVWNASSERLARIVESIQDEQVNIIVATGRELTAEERRLDERHIKVVRYVPFTSLRGRLNAAIFHGGFVTLLTLIACEVPAVIIPVGADQFLNGRLVSTAGAGIALDPGEATPEAIRNALWRVLDEPTYREKTKKIRAEMNALPGVDDAVALLERLARERKPILST